MIETRQIVSEPSPSIISARAISETVLTFGEQADRWLHDLASRPEDRAIKPGTLLAYRSHLNNWILPRLKNEPIETFKNAGLKKFVASLRETQALQPKTIVGIVSVLKSVVASVIDEEGEKLNPREWNHDFALVPKVSRRKQHRPMATRAHVEKAVSDSPKSYKALYALLAGSGVRISEALALRIGDDGKHSCWNPETAQIEVRTAIWKGREQATKSEAGNRTVDICAALNNFLKALTKDRKLGEYLFTSRSGGPAHEMTLRRFSLEKLDLGDISFHSFRRFRITHLRSTAAVPEEIIRFWAGHRSGVSETDGYSRLAENVAYRREAAERVGLGFSL